MPTPVLVRLTESNQSVTLTLDEAEVADETRFRTAIITQLGPFYPDIAAADIRREDRDGNPGAVVTKRAGTKGGPHAVCSVLRTLPEEVNPAQVLAWDLALAEMRGTLTLDMLLSQQSAIAAAIESGDAATALCDR